MNYLTQYGTRKTPQSEPIPGETMVENSAGGFAYGVDNWTRLNRFLILGSEGGSYYAGEQKLTKENAEAVIACVKEDGLRAVRIICDISKEGRAPKNDPALFALAICAGLGDDATRKAALDALPEVARIGTHLFHFAQYVEQFRGWGRGLRRGIAAWYTEKDADKLAYQLVKYRQRDGWSHRDLLRLSHPVAGDETRNLLFKYAVEQASTTEGDRKHTKLNDRLPRILEGFERAQIAETPADTAKLVREYGLPREALRTDHLNSNEVWMAMLDQGMPMTAMIRNLATMTRNELLTPTSEATGIITGQLRNAEAIRKARVHPIAVLAALKTYEAGHSVRGSNVWTPLPQIVDALDEAFYLAFDNVEATGKRRCIALDVSGSMWSGYVAGVPGLTPAVASAAMAMVSVKTGDPYEVVAFTTERGWGYGRGGSPTAPAQIIPGLSGMTLSGRQRLDDVLKVTEEYSRFMGGTDCALPMVYATEKSREFDIFEVYTDSETWAGSIHPSQALREYRRQSGINAKLVVVGMVSNGFSIADPNDPGMLDVVGFDTSTPNLISAFAEGGF